MRDSLLSVKGLNVLVYLILGMNVLILGAVRMTRVEYHVQGMVAAVLLVLGLFAIWANTSRLREHMDEMASYHDREAASRSLVTAAVLVSIGCVTSMLAPVEWDFCDAGLIVMGSAMVIHGLTFAMLEREDVYADYKDA